MNSTPLVFFPTQPKPQADDRPPIVGSRVELQLLTTLHCNLKCTYCSISEGGVLESQGNVTYSMEALDNFIQKHLDGYDVYVTFYGGEPTLNKAFMQEVMTRYPNFRFQLQSNGTLLDKLPDNVLAKLSNILVSIDGGETTTDGYRGRGIYRQVQKNLRETRDRIGGTVTARMTWSNDAITFEEIDALAEAFDYVYFQFVAGEAYTAQAVEGRKAVLSKLIERFFASTEHVYPIIPLMGAVRNKVMPKRAVELYDGKTQCRVSTHILNVMPDGKIYPCPDMMHLPEMLQGDLNGNWLRPSPLQPHPNMPCSSCEAFSWCRGNCMKNLYMAYVKGDERYRKNVTDPICELVRFMGQEIDRHRPAEWFAALPLAARKQITDCEVYEYVEIMP
ncbi:MAG: SPASM domain-containing protein [Paraburkholderia sp.]|uniref:radical SAM/SPASM domain-containing protein n=1 Tax=Paraburkholderia sp. TaxID=1926495 RepID=UPI001210A33B|nr:radical SAM protein [Paraburkholderia sp.]TAM03741.1 MAG: SPASM domain-containing protein [Paraburkholderia sp.]